MYVRNCWYVAAWDYELDGAGPIARMILNEPIALYRTDRGEVVALEDRCAHRLAPLSKGRCEGEALRCMYHGVKFDRTGACVEIPGQAQVSARMRVRSYPVIERHSWIWVWMGDPALADDTLIPPAVGLKHADWILRSGQMDYEANYLLVNDNLTDFSHLSYVHANSFGATEEFARTRPNIELLDRGIRVSRWLADARKPGKGPFPNFDFPTASWQTYDYLAPGVLLMMSAIYPREVMVRSGDEAPTTPPLRSNFTSQAVTPTTDRTTTYRYSWGPDAATGTAEQAELMAKVAVMAFTEDREMIEAQQKVIDLDPDHPMVMTNADVGPMQMRAVLKRLQEAESRTAEAQPVAAE